MTGRHSHVIYSVAAVILLLLVTAAILTFVGYRKGELCMPTESQENIHPGLQVGTMGQNRKKHRINGHLIDLLSHE